MTPRRVLLIIVFLYFANDVGTVYGDWFAPFAWTHYLLYESWPDRIRPFDHIVALCLFFGSRRSDGKGPRVTRMRQSLLVSVGAIVVLFLYGVLQGGDPWAGLWQVYLLVSGVLFAFAVATLFKTPEHYAQLGKVVLAAGAYRALMCWLYYLIYIHGSDSKSLPQYLTTHDDTVIWVVSILVLFVHLVQSRGVWPRVGSLLFICFLLGAVFFNQRRMAWVSLAMGLTVVIGLMAPGKAKRRVVRCMLALAPIMLVYTVVGWGRPGRLFKPLQSFSTVSTAEDASTKARDAENLGLITTSNFGGTRGMLVGTGWGHPYIAVTDKFSDAAGFPLWQYIPHNNILGLLAFSGVIGFCGYWMMFPTAMFLNARMARLANAQRSRNVGLIGAAQLVVCANQYYGDMGLYFVKSVYMASISYAIALRLPILSGTLAPSRRRRLVVARASSQSAA